MCLATPMRILAIDGVEARCEARGVGCTVSLQLLQDAPPAIGDWVLVHVGYALQVLDAEGARETWSLIDDLARVADGA